MHLRSLRVLATAPLALACAALLAACGSTTTTVTAPPRRPRAPRQPRQPRTATATSDGSPTSHHPGAGDEPERNSTQSTARTAPEPAFTQKETHAEGLPGALATVRSLGYTPQNPSEYHAEQTLRVLDRDPRQFGPRPARVLLRRQPLPRDGRPRAEHEDLRSPPRAKPKLRSPMRCSGRAARRGSRASASS